MANKYSQRTYDNALLLKAAGAVAASADGTLIVDVGNGLVDAAFVVDVSAIEVDSADELYTIYVEGSPDANFGTAGNIAVVGMMKLGAATPMAPQGFADTVGRYMVPVRNERNGTTYRYIRIRTVVAGVAVVTGINYAAWLAKDDD